MSTEDRYSEDCVKEKIALLLFFTFYVYPPVVHSAALVSLLKNGSSVPVHQGRDSGTSSHISFYTVVLPDLWPNFYRYTVLVTLHH